MPFLRPSIVMLNAVTELIDASCLEAGSRMWNRIRGAALGVSEREFDDRAGVLRVCSTADGRIKYSEKGKGRGLQ